MYVLMRKGTVVALLMVLGSLLAGPVFATDPPRGLTGSPENPLTPLEKSYKYTSQEGNFRIIWPSGCAGLRTRTPIDDDLDAALEAGLEYMVQVSCDRHGAEGAGCSATAIFNPRDPQGGPAGPAEVVARLEAMLQQFGAEIKRQSPLRKDFGGGLMVEGMDVLAAQAGGSGQIWLRGLLVDGEIYLLAAWDLTGGVWKNPEYAQFMNSFQPGTDNQ